MSVDTKIDFCPPKQYPNLEAPNVYYKVTRELIDHEAKNNREVRAANVGAEMVELVERLAKKHHNWTFVGTMRNSYQTEHRQFHVYEKNELLGEITIERIGNNPAYVVQSWRIANGTRWSRNIDKAMTLVKENMFRRTREEVAVSVHYNVESAIERSVLKYENAVSQITGWAHSLSTAKDLVIETFRFVENMGESFTNSLPTNIKEEYEKYLSNRDALQVTTQLRDAIHNKTGNLVMVMGNGEYDYYNPSYIKKVWRVTAEEMRRHTWDSQCIGMLKLVEDNNFINGMGYRFNETAYYILKEPK